MSIGPCLNLGYNNCELLNLGRQRKSNEHHLYFPAHWYTTPLETSYRDLEENKIQMCICAHNELHRIKQPPEKPHVADMILALTVQFETEDNYVTI